MATGIAFGAAEITDRKSGLLLTFVFGFPLTLVSTLIVIKRVRQRRAIDRELENAGRAPLRFYAGEGLGFVF